MDETPRRPRWRKKRWWAAAAFSLLAWYPLSSGPYLYCVERSWLPGYDPLDDIRFYEPVWRTLDAIDAFAGWSADTPGLRWRWTLFNRYFADMADRHQAAEAESPKAKP